MTTTILAVLCLYLAACYAYGAVLLVNVLRGVRAEEEPVAAPAAAAEAPAGPRAGILRAAPVGEAAERPAARAAA